MCPHVRLTFPFPNIVYTTTVVQAKSWEEILITLVFSRKNAKIFLKIFNFFIQKIDLYFYGVYIVTNRSAGRIKISTKILNLQKKNKNFIGIRTRNAGMGDLNPNHLASGNLVKAEY